MSTHQLSLLVDAPARRAKKPSPVVRELKRRGSNRERVLERLKQGPATTMDLIAVGGARAIGRVWELRKAGHVIHVEHVIDGLYRYTLTREKSR